MLKNNSIEFGTFLFCKECPENDICCTGKTVDPPVLTPKDIWNISNKKSIPIKKFSIPTNGTLAKMKTYNNKCCFYKNGNCSIYDERPIDCRLFPFDIRRNDKKELILIWYYTACPKSINAKQYEKKARALLPHLKPYIEEYADYYSPLLDKQHYKVVETLNL